MTKVMATLPIFICVITRGLVMPLKRGVGVWRLLPIRFVGITLVCSIADGVKVLVFTFPMHKRESNSGGTDAI